MFWANFKEQMTQIGSTTTNVPKVAVKCFMVPPAPDGAVGVKTTRSLSHTNKASRELIIRTRLQQQK